MVLERQSFRVGSLAALAAGIAFTISAQTAVAQPDPPQQSSVPQAQNVPDAPKPQTLPKLNTITPTAPMVLAPEPQTPAATEPNAPEATLPGAPVAQKPNPDDGAAPEIPVAGQGSQAAFRMGTVNVNFVEIPFTVKDSKGTLVPGLTWRDVRIYEDGQREQMRLFTTDPFPLSVALVIDQSVTFDTMTKINNSLRALQGAFTPYDEIAIFTYNNGVRKQTAFTAAQSARLGQVLEQSKGKGREPVQMLGGPLSQTTMKNNEQVDPNTSPNHGRSVGNAEYAEKEQHTLLDAILAAATETSTAGKGRRRIVYVISDGKEYGSVAKEKEVIKYCQTNKVEVYATLVGDSAVPGLGFLDRIHLPLTMRDDILPRITTASGGQIDPEWRQGQIEKSFARITEEVRNQYTVGYYTHASPFNEKFRKVEVRVMRPNLTVISKDGYYPSASDSRPAPVTPSAVP